MSYLTDTEKRLLFSALRREKEVCKKIDDTKVEDATCKMLVPVVESLERKFYYDRFEQEIRKKAIEEFLERGLEALEDFKYWEDDSGCPIHSISETQRISKCKELIKQIAEQMKEVGE